MALCVLIMDRNKRKDEEIFGVAYPSLRVESEKIEEERVGGFPPGLLRPASIESLDL